MNYHSIIYLLIWTYHSSSYMLNNCCLS